LSALTPEIIFEILDQAERNNFDFKRGFSWRDKTRETLGVVADIMALSNIRDGGRVILGIDNRTRAFAGVNGEWWNSFDTTRVMDVVNKYCDPLLDVTIFTFNDIEHDGNRGTLVVLQVAEFSEIPTICKKTGNLSSGGEPIFKEGQVLIRTNRAATQVISNAHDMRELIERATVKNRERILRQAALISPEINKQIQQQNQQLQQQSAQGTNPYDNDLQSARGEI